MSDQIAAMFRRRPNQGWFHAGRFDVTGTDIVCALGIVSMFMYGISADLFNKLVFYAPLVREGEVWRIITWPIATEPTVWGLLGIIFFWLFGQQLEGLFGRGKFVAWVLAITIIPALLLTGLGAIESSFDFTSVEFGLSSLFLGGIWVYAATYPGVQVVRGHPAVGARRGVHRAQPVAVLGRRRHRQGRLPARRRGGVAGRRPVARARHRLADPPPPARRQQAARARPSKPKKQKKPESKGSPSGSSNATVVEGPWRSGPPPMPPPSGPPSLADQEELDTLLDKIGATGMDSLTNDEKKRLNDLSKRLRNR